MKELSRLAPRRSGRPTSSFPQVASPNTQRTRSSRPAGRSQPTGSCHPRPTDASSCRRPTSRRRRKVLLCRRLCATPSSMVQTSTTTRRREPGSSGARVLMSLRSTQRPERRATCPQVPARPPRSSRRRPPRRPGRRRNAQRNPPATSAWP